MNSSLNVLVTKQIQFKATIFKSVRSLGMDRDEEAYNIEETLMTCDDVLRNIYEEKCSFPLTRHEVQDIQHAVEIMVLFLLTVIYEQTRFSDLVFSNKKIIKTLTSIKNPHRIHEAFRTENLLKVGSYYENTKNCYPDEFDYICVIADCGVEDYKAMKTITSNISDIFHKSLHGAIKNGLKFPMGTCLEFDQYVRMHGPADSLKFKYRSVNDPSKCRSIYVDLSPACKVSIRDELPREMRIQYPEWKDLILETGSFLIVKFFNCGHPKNETKTKISITESEKLYMQNKMSEEHKRIYRLLKFIFHGDLPDEVLKRHTREQSFILKVEQILRTPSIMYDMSSYIIKTLMFHHCHACIRTVETTDTDCVISTLKYLIALFGKEQGGLCIEGKYPSSVSVLTMTGEDIEFVDDPYSSIKIVNVLKTIVRAITDTADLSKHPETSTQQITDLIPIANQLQTKTEILTREKFMSFFMLSTLLTIGVALSMPVYVGVQVYMYIVNWHHESKSCFFGQSAVGGIIFAEHENLTSNFSQTLHADIPRNISKYFLCLDQPFSSGEAVAKTSGLYFCGYGQSCTADRCYSLQTGKDGHDQGAFCDSYTLPGNKDGASCSARNNTSMEYSAKRVVCVWDIKPCFNESIRNSDGSDSWRDNITCFDQEMGNNLHSVIQERNIMDCEASKFENDTLNMESICCCNSYPCSNPVIELDDVKIFVLVPTFMVIVSWIIVVSYSYCKHCIDWFFFKKGLQKGNIQQV